MYMQLQTLRLETLDITILGDLQPYRTRYSEIFKIQLGDRDCEEHVVSEQMESNSMTNYLRLKSQIGFCQGVN